MDVRNHRGIVIVLTIIFLIISLIAVYSLPYFAQNLIRNNNYSKAVSLISVRNIFPPHNSYNYSLRAYANYKLKNYDAAVNDFDKAYRLENDEYKMMNFDNKIYIKYVQKDYEGAIKDFDAEIEKTSDSYTKDSLMWDKAQFLYNTENYNEALKIYNQLLINSNDDGIFLLKSRLYYERAQILTALDRHKEALQDISDAQDLNLEQTFQNPIPKPQLIMEGFEESPNADL